MTHNIDFSIASSDAVMGALFGRIEAIRLSRNVSQAALAKEAGVSRSTMTRLAKGQGISVDSFVRILLALGLADHLAALLPNPNVRPVERIRLGGAERRRASPESKAAGDWAWRDEAKVDG
jgi:putative transcriptional regulator